MSSNEKAGEPMEEASARPRRTRRRKRRLLPLLILLAALAVAVPVVGDVDAWGSGPVAQPVRARAATSSAAMLIRFRFTFSSPPRGYCARRQKRSRRQIFQKFTSAGLAAGEKQGIIEKKEKFSQLFPELDNFSALRRVLFLERHSIGFSGKKEA